MSEPSQEKQPLDLGFTPEMRPTDREPRPGELCPQCGEGRLDYDGLLNLTCPECGFTAGGCFT